MRRMILLLAILCTCQLIALAQEGSVRTRAYDTLTVYFEFNRDTLKQEEVSKLSAFLRNVFDSVFITGYTDSAGTRNFNQRLSLRRARSVANLIKGPVVREQGPVVREQGPVVREQGSVLRVQRPVMRVQGMGEDAPVPGGDSLNRRVVAVGSYRTKTGAAAPPKPSDEPDTVITLTDILFIEDSPNLTEASRLYMPAYIGILRQYKDDSLEINGYCNSLHPITDPNDPLFKLSVQRAKFIFDYLIDAGFDPTKLSYKGRGNAKFRNPHPITSEEAHANMRVEILVFRKHIDK